MRSAFAVIILTIGTLFAAAGAGVASSGVSLSGSAQTSQYGQALPNAAPALGQGTAPGLQLTRQVEVTAAPGTLPFTGYAAIVVLLVGLGLAAAGLVLRRRDDWAPRRAH